jgi:ribonuclease HII
MRIATAMHRFAFERALLAQGARTIAGLDEVGRGPLAGPVVAAAVVLPAAWIQAGMPAELEGLNDSKQLTAAQRQRFFQCLTGNAQVGFGIARVEPDVIDAINILQATHRAMRLALEQLHPVPDHLLVDGREVKSLTVPQTALVKGDSRSYSIAAASVVAKVTRDRLMEEYDRVYPGYGFAEHKGYGTPRHLATLAERGPCPIHRRSFAPLKARQLEWL